LSSPIHSAGRTTFFFFFLLTGHFLCWARRLLFFVCLLPLSSVSTRHFFCCSVRSLPLLLAAWRAVFFLSFPVPSLPLLGAHIFFCLLPLSSVSARHFFICSVRSLLLCWARAEFFLDASAQPARHAADFFSLCSVTSPHSHACVSGAPAIFFSCPVASGQQQLHAQFFCHSHTLLPCAQPFVLVTSRCVTSAARKIFFCHFRAEV
jgi:hypothetical protein